MQDCWIALKVPGVQLVKLLYICPSKNPISWKSLPCLRRRCSAVFRSNHSITITSGGDLTSSAAIGIIEDVADDRRLGGGGATVCYQGKPWYAKFTHCHCAVVFFIWRRLIEKRNIHSFTARAYSSLHTVGTHYHSSASVFKDSKARGEESRAKPLAVYELSRTAEQQRRSWASWDVLSFFAELHGSAIDYPRIPTKRSNFKRFLYWKNTINFEFFKLCSLKRPEHAEGNNGNNHQITMGWLNPPVSSWELLQCLWISHKPNIISKSRLPGCGC